MPHPVSGSCWILDIVHVVPGSGLQWYGFAESRTTCRVHSSIQYCVSKLVIIGVAQSVLMKIVGE